MATQYILNKDVVIIMSYAQMDFEKAKTVKPWLVFPDSETNKLQIQIVAEFNLQIHK